MTDEQPKSGDLLGLRSWGDGFKALANSMTDFLHKIVGPPSEEFGLMLRDRVSFWRAKQAVKILQKSEEMLNASGGLQGKSAPPRLLFSIIEHGSWIDDDNIQKMWAGLLTSSCTKDGRDDGNLIFINLLSQLTNAQAMILNYLCQKTEKWVAQSGFFQAKPMKVTQQELIGLTGLEDIHTIDLEIDHLRSLGLVYGGLDIHSEEAEISPTDLALHMFVRCQGSTQTPPDYFGLVYQSP